MSPRTTLKMLEKADKMAITIVAILIGKKGNVPACVLFLIMFAWLRAHVTIRALREDEMEDETGDTVGGDEGGGSGGLSSTAAGHAAASGSGLPPPPPGLEEVPSATAAIRSQRYRRRRRGLSYHRFRRRE